MPTTLITGANKGLGRETAAQLIAAGHEVWIGARDAERGTAAAQELGGRFVQLDITDDASVAAAVETISAAGGLDVLINNAGIIGPRVAVGETTAQDLADTYATNVFGQVRVTHAFLPLLEQSSRPVVVFVSSGLGSHGVTGDPDRIEYTINAIPYTSSKAALNMVGAQYAKAYPGMRINVVDPGYTATDFNGHSGPQTVQEGAEIIIRLAQVDADGPTGGYFDRHGVVAW